MEDNMMKDMGMEMDPVSGNEIPPGVNAENVRDDIDAKLSDGEYVMPADVVKFFGVAHFEKMIKRAKQGMEEFEAEGRIGGEAPEGEMEMAAGGYIPGNDINGMTDRLMAAAEKDPSVANMLKAKGIFMQAPMANSLDQQTAMMGGRTPTQAAPPKVAGKDNASAYAEGGTVANPLTDAYNPANYMGTFNPYAHTPGFQKSNGGPGPAPAAPAAPVQCPTGFVLDPATNTCVPVGSTATAPQRESRDQNRGEYYGNNGQQSNPSSWMDKYDYSDPDVLYEQTMTSLGAGEAEGKGPQTLTDSLLGIGKNILAGGIIGKFMSTTNVAQTMANARALEAMGRQDLADKVKAQAGVYVKENGLSNVPEPWRDGDQLYAKIEESGRITYDPNAAETSSGGTSTSQGGGSSSGSSSGGGSSAQDAAARASQARRDYDSRDSRSDKNSNSWSDSNQVSTPTRESKTSAMTAARAPSSSGNHSVSASTAAGLSGSQMKAGSEVGSGPGGTDRVGPMAKGGLVKRPTKKTKK
jgi:hypothetical protein